MLPGRMGNGMGILRRHTAVLAFILAVLPQGAWMIGAFGPLTMPDADLHVSGAWAVATGQAHNPVSGGRHAQTLTGPANLFTDANGTRNDTVTGLLTDMIRRDGGGDTMLDTQRATLDRPSRTVRFTGRANQYQPVMFLPQAAGMRIAMLRHGWTSWSLLRASRIASSAFYLTVGALAVLLSRSWTMTAALASPVPVFCAAAGMADANVIAYCALYVAVFAALRRRNRPFGWGETLLAAVLTIPLPGLKTVYATFALLYLTLPAHMWPWRRRLAAVVAALAVAAPAWLWYSSRALAVRAAGVDVAANRAWMLAHPARTLMMLAANLLLLLTVVAWREWTAWLIPPLAAMLAGRGRTDGRVALAAVAAAVLSLALTLLSLALTWTPGLPARGCHAILPGFQERYLWPLLTLPACAHSADRQRRHGASAPSTSEGRMGSACLPPTSSRPASSPRRPSSPLPPSA